MRLLGVEIGLDPSWFIIFALIVWTIMGRFAALGQRSLALQIVAAVTSALLFFASIVFHELSHSLVARARGISVRRITLFVFGGVAEIMREPRHALDEFLIAVAGPLASVAAASGFAIAGLMMRLVRLEAPATMFGWLALVNFLLAVFNLLPGYPLDGGRVFRALVWAVTGSLRRATMAAGAIGQLLAWGFMLLGVLMLLRGNLAGAWWIFIGLFLNNAAVASVQQVTLSEALAGHTVREVMQPDCPTVPPDMSLAQVVEDVVLSSGRRSFPVVRDGKLLGLMTLHEFRRISRSEWLSTPVSQAMIPPERLHTARPDERVSEVVARMTAADINQMPVLDDGRLAGMVSRDGILAFLRTRAELGLESEADGPVRGLGG
jgi:Zn-dependent protease